MGRRPGLLIPHQPASGAVWHSQADVVLRTDFYTNAAYGSVAKDKAWKNVILPLEIFPFSPLKNEFHLKCST